MTRRSFFAASAAGLSAPPLLASQGAYPGAQYRDYSRCLPDFLRELAREAYERRRKALAALSTPEAIRRRQQFVRETFWRLVGGMPERTPLNARVVGGFDRPGYRVEKVIYESRPGFLIPANLYIPRQARPPLPGVLFQMGHALNGKASAPYQRCCQALAQLGYLVLAFDPMGQGERVYYPDSSGIRTRLASADEEHTLPGRQMLLLGDTATRMQVWDAVRSLDYLASHPLVDPARLASTGQSGGGTLTMLLACVDDRLAAAAVACGNTENFACQDFIPPGSTDDAEQNWLGSAPLGLDRWDWLYPLAPKPLLVSVSDKDFFGTYSPNYLRSGWEEYQQLKRVYELLGHGERLAWTSTPLPHALSYDTRLKIYNWFERWLKGSSRVVQSEPPTAPEPDAQLWVAPSGSVVKSFASRTPLDLNRDALRRLPAPRPTAERLARMLALERLAETPSLRVLGRAPAIGLHVEAIEVPAAQHVWLPAWLFVPDKEEPGKPLLLVVDPAGRNVRWREGELYQELALKGWPVCAMDVRGVGDLRPEYGRGAPGYARSHNDDENYAWASLILGRPLLGQRVTDIMAMVAALAAYPSLRGRSIWVAARGELAVPALFATALEPRIRRLYLAGAVVSMQSVVESEHYRQPLSNFVFSMLEEVDLPQLAELISPRRIVLAGTVDGAGRRLGMERVREVWKAANVVVEGEARWDVEALTRDL